MKFLHSADWQLGARFARFAEAAERLRAVRVETLARTLALAAERGADAFVIAGDLFEDNQVDSELVDRVVGLFESASPLPILVLPGNHDPYSGPDSVWDRLPFERLGSQVHVFREAEAIEVAGAWVMGSPLQQKVSNRDPSLKLVQLGEGLDSERPRIGITHGALAIPGKHQENDFPIALDAASRAGLDYLAVGHWHRWQVHDHGRLVMPGTPEPDGFPSSQAGSVAWVEVEAAGQAPRVERLSVGGLEWLEVEYLFSAEAEGRGDLEGLAERTGREWEQLVVRVVLSGEATPECVRETRAWLEEHLARVAAFEVIDRSRPVLSATDRTTLSQEHPLVGQVLDDLEQLQVLLAGGGLSPVAESGLEMAALRRLLEEARIPLGELRTVHIEQARELITEGLREGPR